MISALPGLVLLLLAQPAPAQDVDPSVRPSGFVEGCLDAGCHADVVDAPHVHGPAAAGACRSCHKYEDAEAHTFSVEADERALCGFCHVAQTVVAARTVHEPLARGQCLVCHDPHGSRSRGLPRAEDVRAQCLDCHAGITAGMAHVHTPVADTTCTVCHTPHASDHEALLSEEPRALCLDCHAQVLEQARRSLIAAPGDSGELPRALLDDRSHAMVHAGQIDGCAQCHRTHASDHAGLLNEEPARLCASCHEDILRLAEGAPVPHTIVTEGDACLNCHTPHGSPIGALMRDHPTTTCLTCHDETVQRPDGTPVGGVRDMAEPNEHKHGAVREGRCRGCHEVHGSDHRSLLTHGYTPAFYQPFELEAYALCFECHDENLVLEQTTRTATNFRNGDHNLHFAHVVATESPGRTCRACHATHTSEAPRLLASSVPYGQWQIPIRFRPTETGGSCAAGCHRARGYDRVSPVEAGAP